MKVLKSSEMKECDEKTIKEIGIPSLVLMENAARGILKVLTDKLGVGKVKKILVVAGKGNNGGDGLAVARLLHLIGKEVKYYLVYGNVASEDAKIQLEILKRLKIQEENDIENIKNYDVVIDALYGTGFKPPADESASRIIEYVNKYSKFTIAVDIPSGLSADSCEIFEPSIRADITVTFQLPKICHVTYPALKRCGEVYIVDISIPEGFARNIRRELLIPSKAKVPKREADYYKNKLGHVLIIGGSEGKTGAVVMSAKSATETGSGLVTVGVPEDLNPIFEAKLTEEMSLPLPEGKLISSSAVDMLEEGISKYSAIAVGMGMGVYEEGYEFLKNLLKVYDGYILLDADALNNIARYGSPSMLRDTEATIIITPHIGEMSRLTGLDSLYIANNIIDVASEYGERWGCYIVLKSATTVIATPEGNTFISSWGTPAMAKGGSGDVLSGILISLLGRNMKTEEALRLGILLHSFAGHYAELSKHRESVRAEDIITKIHEVYRFFEDPNYILNSLDANNGKRATTVLKTAYNILTSEGSIIDYPILFVQPCYTDQERKT